MKLKSMIRRMKTTLFVSTAAMAGTVCSSCGLDDLRDSAIAGVQSFSQSYVADFFASIVPSASSLIS